MHALVGELEYSSLENCTFAKNIFGLTHRITGLDPAAPLYIKWSYDAIRKADAPFVDIIHTNGERLGEAWAR